MPFSGSVAGPPVRISPAAPADAAVWRRMRHALWPAEAGEHDGDIAGFFAGTVSRPAAVLLAWDGERAVGFVELSIREYAEGCYSGRVAFLEGWYVEPDARGRGVGAALVRATEEWGRAQGCTELGSDTQLENTASAGAHRALGFEEVERIVCFRKDL